MLRRFVLCALALGAAACSKTTTAAVGQKGDACGPGVTCATGLGCTETPPGAPATPGHPVCAAPSRRYTFRAIAGVSMGAAGSSRLAAAHPERFDAVGLLGGPLDAGLLLHTIATSHMGGFCPAAALEAALALDKLDGGNRLDREDGVAGCTPADVPPATRYSHAQRFNHWYFTTNGGSFDRDAYIDIFTDLTAAIGNPLSQNPSSPALAAPLTPAQYAAATCAQPFRVPKVVDRRYSPHGEHSAITFCDGEAPVQVCADGAVVDWCAAAALGGRKLAQSSDADLFCSSHGGGAHEPAEHGAAHDVDVFWDRHGRVNGCWAGTRKVPFALAIDLNGNGRRDLHEPLLLQATEPFDDVGADGCPDPLEDGKGGCTTEGLSPYKTGNKDPNGDDYDAKTNPAGTEGDGLYQQGEPFQDVGLDGVAGTGDPGEGDGRFSVSDGYQKWLDADLRTQLGKMSDTQLRALDVYSEGGIRDVFDLGAQAEALAGGVKRHMYDGVNRFEDFRSIPAADGQPWGHGGLNFDPLKFDVPALGRNPLVLYGDPNATKDDIRAGDGDHVGSIPEVFYRFVVMFRWLSGRWDATLPPRQVHGQSRVDFTGFQSAQLAGEQNFAVQLPVGYDDAANASRRYPVLYLLHGYGQTAEDMAGTGAVLTTLNTVGLARELIVVFPSGQCCLKGPKGERVCRDHAADGSSYGNKGYLRECQRGTFYVNRVGTGQGDTSKYGDAVLELMDVVDQRYRTLAPADGPAY